MTMIYLDYAATTPVDEQVIGLMSDLFSADGDFGNPSSGHLAGRRSLAHVEHAATQLAGLIGCSPGDIIWTSGATESDNLAILGAAGLAAFGAVRASSFHHVDILLREQLLGLRWNGWLELGGIACLAVAAARFGHGRSRG